MADPLGNRGPSLTGADGDALAAFPIVGIGASAGGLEACTQLLEHLPAGIGLALVLVQHLDPNHASVLPDLLSRVSPMVVERVQDGMAVQPGHVYVVPPNVTMTIAGGVLRLRPRSQSRAHYMPIDVFFRSLAEDQESRAVGIILSGTGSDGALGLEEIKERGGISFVQEEQSAKFAGMPHSAMVHATIDFILPPAGIAQELRRIAQHPYVTARSGHEPEPPLPSPAQEDMGQILRLLRGATGVDFAHYKPSTIRRRIMRRMTLRQFESFGEYTAYLRAHREELDALYHDLLIKVTGFFRDLDAFEALRREIFPRLLKEERSPDTPLRIWVPGCATGEEVYSIAICLLECLGEHATQYPIRIFATDLDESALAKARTGQYIENIELDISPERLRRFFTKVDAHYRVNSAIREMCTFARHDLCRDPPFSNLDLVSCRNVLIYLDAVMQRRIIPLFHYALHPGGFLTLGTSETIGTSTDLFTLVDKQHKIYAKVTSALRPTIDFTLREPSGERTDQIPRGTPHDDGLGQGRDVFKEADRVILQAYGPAGVLINEQMDILQFRGDTSHYLRPAPGKASFNLLQMGREGLLVDLRAAIEEAKRTGGPVSRAGVQIAYEGHALTVTLRVMPLKRPPSPAAHYVVLFVEAVSPAIRERTSRLHRWVRSVWAWGTRGRRREVLAPRRVGTSEPSPWHDELEATKQYLQSIIEQHEASTEELRAANEEILSANEELQSTNEELETAKEELQSANEELTTVNEELRGRNVELAQTNNDLSNFFSSGHLPIVMLGRDLRIRRVTATAETILNIIPTDVGRPIGHLNLKIPIPDVETWLVEAIDTGRSSEREVQDRDGHWYSLRIHPYKTTEHAIDGAVLVFIDIASVKNVDRLTHLLAEARSARQFAEGVVQTVREPLVVLDGTLRVMAANPAFYRTFQVTKEATEAHFLYELGHGQWDIPSLRTLLENTLAQNVELDDFAVDHEFPGLGRKHMRLNARCIRQAGQEGATLLLAIEDVTERTRTDDALRRSLTEKEVLLREIHHRVKNNLQIITSLLNLQFAHLQDPAIRALLEDSQRRIGAMALVHEQLYMSLDLARIDMATYMGTLLQQLVHTSGTSDRIRFYIHADEVLLTPDVAIPCGLLLTELLSNALKHAFPAGQSGQVDIELRLSHGHEVTLVVQDTGVGFPVGLDFRHTASLGLQLVCMLTEQLHGTITLDGSSRGTAFTLMFPLETT